MCLLTFLPPGVQPDVAALCHGAAVNTDGHGYALIAAGHLITGRGMHAAAVIEEFTARRAAYPDGPALFHSRFSTHGSTGLDNCHPFPVGGDERTVLAHNGVLPPVVQPAKRDHRSDTRITAEDFLPLFGSLRTRAVRLRFQKWMTPENKIVILTVDRRFREPAYILNESAGLWAGGIWYSNDGYLPQRRLRQWPDTRGGQPDEPCWSCGSTLGYGPEGFCRWCECCLDCGEPPGDCVCYPVGLFDDEEPFGLAALNQR